MHPGAHAHGSARQTAEAQSTRAKVYLQHRSGPGSTELPEGLASTWEAGTEGSRDWRLLHSLCRALCRVLTQLALTLTHLWMRKLRLRERGDLGQVINVPQLSSLTV